MDGIRGVHVPTTEPGIADLLRGMVKIRGGGEFRDVAEELV
jgi:hypothetical protein